MPSLFSRVNHSAYQNCAEKSAENGLSTGCDPGGFLPKSGFQMLYGQSVAERGFPLSGSGFLTV
jgi:hypothetical protein